MSLHGFLHVRVGAARNECVRSFFNYLGNPMFLPQDVPPMSLHGFLYVRVERSGNGCAFLFNYLGNPDMFLPRGFARYVSARHCICGTGGARECRCVLLM
jgi:hypothetical protein